MNITAKDISIDNSDLVIFLKKQTPAFYADLCAKTKLKTKDKRNLTNIWLKVTKYSIKDLDQERSKHPYWKAIKERGSVERNRARRKRFSFYSGKAGEKRKRWSEAELKLFLSLNDSRKDWELAKHFKRAIPAVQHLRRKIQLGKKIAAKKKITKVDNAFLFKMLLIDERALRRLVEGTEKRYNIVNGKVIVNEVPKKVRKDKGQSHHFKNK